MDKFSPEFTAFAVAFDAGESEYFCGNRDDGILAMDDAVSAMNDHVEYHEGAWAERVKMIECRLTLLEYHSHSFKEENAP